ncbi:MAG: universal stress protein [Pseudomonadota bacterium]
MTEPNGKLVALVDGSIYSQSVCDHAVWLAQRTGWSVELVHVLGHREGTQHKDLSGAITLGARTALLEELAEIDAQRAKVVSHRGRAILEDARAIFESAGIENVTSRLRQGDLVESVLDQESDADLVMIGKRGEAADFAKGHLGSNLERIVRSSRKPIFVASRALQPINKVLIAYDGGTSAMKAVDHIARSPIYRGLEVHVVTVGSDTASTRKELEDARAMLKAAGTEAHIEVLSGQPETALGDHVEGHDFDLLVMGAYGHSRIRSMIIGSTTTQMVRSCRIPIVLIR